MRGSRKGGGEVQALRGGEADEAVGAVPVISSSVIASWVISCGIVVVQRDCLAKRVF